MLFIYRLTLCCCTQNQYNYLYRLTVRATDWTPPPAAEPDTEAGTEADAGEPNNNDNDDNLDSGYSEPATQHSDDRPTSHSAQYIIDDAGEDADTAKRISYDMRL